MSEASQKTSMATHVAIGACVAAFIAGVWVLHYALTSTPSSPGPVTFEYISRGSGSLFQSASALTIITARFLLAFGLLWMPLALVSKVIALIAGK